MKKKIICTILSLLTLTYFVGCTLSGTDGKGNGNSQANLSGDPVSEVDPESGNTQTEENTGISNNGGYFVGVDGKIYFRQYSQYSLSGNSYIRGFMKNGTGGYDNSICYFTPDDPDNIICVAEKDEGHGNLYYNDGYIYSTRYDWQEGIAYPVLYRVNLSSASFEDVGSGHICANSDDAKYIMTCTYTSEGNKYVVYESGKECASYISLKENGYSTPIYVDSKNIYLLISSWNNCDSKIYQYDYKTGNMYLLAKVSAPEGIPQDISTPLVKNAAIESNTLSFTLCYVEGVGDYVDAALDVTVSINDKGGASTEVAMFTPTIAENNTYNDNLAGNFTIPNNLSKLEDSSQGDDGFARAVQSIDTVYNRSYAVMANVFYSPTWAQAQMGSYELLSIDYYYYDDENETPTLFNEKNPTSRDLMVRGWYIGKKGSKPEKLLFQHADIQGPEMPQQFDEILYTAEFADDFVFEHIPEGGEIYDDMVKDGMDYLVKYLNEDEYYNPYLDTLPETKDYTNYKEPAINWNDPNAPTPGYLHIKFNREGKINYIRYVIFVYQNVQ